MVSKAEFVETEVNALMARILGQRGPVALADKPSRVLLERCGNKALRNIAMTYVPAKHGGMLVCGPTGAGKTVTAVSVIRRVYALPAAIKRAENGPRTGPAEASPAVWVRSFDLPNARLEKSLGSGESDLVADAKSARFLVLDDLGWESKRASADDVVLEVLACRYDSGLPTLVTTGQRIEALIGRYGDAIVRRIQESGGLTGEVLSLWKEGLK